MSYKRITFRCGFCGKRKYYDEDRPTYIYPVPLPGKPGQTEDNSEGKQACSKCAPKQLRLQKELGLVGGPPDSRYTIKHGG